MTSDPESLYLDIETSGLRLRFEAWQRLEVVKEVVKKDDHRRLGFCKAGCGLGSAEHSTDICGKLKRGWVRLQIPT